MDLQPLSFSSRATDSYTGKNYFCNELSPKQSEAIMFLFLS